VVRIGVSVEGLTEEQFVVKCLAPYFLQKELFLEPISLNGNVSVDRVKHEINKLLFSYDYVTTLYDFYGFARKKEGETKASLEERLLSSLHENRRSKFIPYIQMYEFEGLLFSSPEIIATILQQDDLEPWANNILRRAGGNPEEINNSPQTAPKKRFEAKYARYRETTHSPKIACEIGIDTLREKCTGFNQWLLKLEKITNNS